MPRPTSRVLRQERTLDCLSAVKQLEKKLGRIRRLHDASTFLSASGKDKLTSELFVTATSDVVHRGTSLRVTDQYGHFQQFLNFLKEHSGHSVPAYLRPESKRLVRSTRELQRKILSRPKLADFLDAQRAQKTSPRFVPLTERLNQLLSNPVHPERESILASLKQDVERGEAVHSQYAVGEWELREPIRELTESYFAFFSKLKRVLRRQLRANRVAPKRS